MSNNTETPRQDIYSRITNQIIEALEQGVKSWRHRQGEGHSQ
jgi:antirestriction protein ArdC